MRTRYHYVDFHTTNGIITCGPFQTLDAAFDFARAVDGMWYSKLVFHDDPQLFGAG